MLYAKQLTAVAARPSFRIVQRSTVRRVSSGSGGGPSPAESTGGPKTPGWQIGVAGGVAVAALYAFFIAKPDSVAKSSVPTNQTKNPSHSQTEAKR